MTDRPITKKLLWNKSLNKFEEAIWKVRDNSSARINEFGHFKNGEMAINEMKRTKEEGYISNEFVQGYCFSRFASLTIKNLEFEWFTSPGYLGKEDLKKYGRKFNDGDVRIFYKYNHDEEILIFSGSQIFKTSEFVKTINQFNDADIIIKEIIRQELSGETVFFKPLKSQQ